MSSIDAVNTTMQAALMRLQITQGSLEAATGTLGLAVNNISDTLRNMEVCAASGQIAHQVSAIQQSIARPRSYTR